MSRFRIKSWLWGGRTPTPPAYPVGAPPVSMTTPIMGRRSQDEQNDAEILTNLQRAARLQIRQSLQLYEEGCAAFGARPDFAGLGVPELQTITSEEHDALSRALRAEILRAKTEATNRRNAEVANRQVWLLVNILNRIEAVAADVAAVESDPGALDRLMRRDADA